MLELQLKKKKRIQYVHKREMFEYKILINKYANFFMVKLLDEIIEQLHQNATCYM